MQLTASLPTKYPPTQRHARTHTHSLPPLFILGWRRRRLKRHNCLEGGGVIDWWSFAAQGIQSCNQFVLIDCPHWETAEAVPLCAPATHGMHSKSSADSFDLGGRVWVRVHSSGRMQGELTKLRRRRFATLHPFSAPTPHSLAFISIIVIGKLIQLYCNYITWLMIQSLWNLNRASTWVSIANEHVFFPAVIFYSFSVFQYFHIPDIFQLSSYHDCMMQFTSFPPQQWKMMFFQCKKILSEIK